MPNISNITLEVYSVTDIIISIRIYKNKVFLAIRLLAEVVSVMNQEDILAMVRAARV